MMARPRPLSRVALLLGAGGALAAAGLITGGFGLSPPGPVRRTGGDDELVVATFNIRNGLAWDGTDSWVFRARSTARTARDLGADVLAVQEAHWFQNRFLRSALREYDAVGRGRSRWGGEWCTVFVRRDRLRVVRTRTRWFGDDPDRPGALLPGTRIPRIGTIVRLALEDRDPAGEKREFDLANTHLDHRRAENRRRSVEQLVSWLDPAVPRVVVGDLNASWPGEPELFAVLTGAGLDDALPRDAGGTFHSFRGGVDHPRIDHIFVSDHWEVVDSRVEADLRTRRLPSDHWPVVARLRLR